MDDSFPATRKEAIDEYFLNKGFKIGDNEDNDLVLFDEFGAFVMESAVSDDRRFKIPLAMKDAFLSHFVEILDKDMKRRPSEEMISEIMKTWRGSLARSIGRDFSDQEMKKLDCCNELVTTSLSVLSDLVKEIDAETKENDIGDDPTELEDMDISDDTTEKGDSFYKDAINSTSRDAEYAKLALAAYSARSEIGFEMPVASDLKSGTRRKKVPYAPKRKNSVLYKRGVSSFEKGEDKSVLYPLVAKANNGSSSEMAIAFERSTLVKDVVFPLAESFHEELKEWLPDGGQMYLKGAHMEISSANPKEKDESYKVSNSIYNQETSFNGISGPGLHRTIIINDDGLVKKFAILGSNDPEFLKMLKMYGNDGEKITNSEKKLPLGATKLLSRPIFLDEMKPYLLAAKPGGVLVLGDGMYTIDAVAEDVGDTRPKLPIGTEYPGTKLKQINKVENEKGSLSLRIVLHFGKTEEVTPEYVKFIGKASLLGWRPTSASLNYANQGAKRPIKADKPYHLPLLHVAKASIGGIAGMSTKYEMESSARDSLVKRAKEFTDAVEGKVDVTVNASYSNIFEELYPSFELAVDANAQGETEKIVNLPNLINDEISEDEVETCGDDNTLYCEKGRKHVFLLLIFSELLQYETTWFLKQGYWIDPVTKESTLINPQSSTSFTKNITDTEGGDRKIRLYVEEYANWDKWTQMMRPTEKLTSLLETFGASITFKIDRVQNARGVRYDVNDNTEDNLLFNKGTATFLNRLLLKITSGEDRNLFSDSLLEYQKKYYETPRPENEASDVYMPFFYWFEYQEIFVDERGNKLVASIDHENFIREEYVDMDQEQ